MGSVRVMASEKTVQAGHVLVDILSLWMSDEESPPEEVAPAMSVALERFNDIDAFAPETEAVFGTPVVAASAAMLVRIARELVRVSGNSEMDVVAWLRDQVDKMRD